jgi:hypothetical protein
MTENEADIEKCHKLLDDVNVPQADDGKLSTRVSAFLDLHVEGRTNKQWPYGDTIDE